MSPEVWAAVYALDRLNAYARWEGRIVESRVIYGFKGQAIRQLQEAHHRRVYWDGPCHHCGGSGWHRAPGPRTWGTDLVGEICHTCLTHRDTAGTGRVRLRFVETKIGSLVWHSPHHLDVGAELWHTLDDEPAEVDDTWSPRMPGEALDAHEVARDLLSVEHWLLQTWLLVPQWLRTYSLHIPPGMVAWQEPAVQTWCARHGRDGEGRIPADPDDDGIPF